MQFGLCTISNEDADVETVLDRAAAAGYDGVEIWGGDHVGDDLADCRAIGRAAVDRDLAIPVYGSYLRAGTERFDATMERELDRTAALGADLIRVWAGDREYGDHDPEYWQQVVEDLRRLSAAAAARDVGVTVEKHEGTVTNEAVGARRLVDAVDAPNSGLNWQPLFDASAEAILAEADALAPLVNNVHLQAVAEPGGTDRCALADAFFDVEAVVETFQAADFDGFANVEFVAADRPYRAAIEDDLRFLRRSG